MRRVARPDAVIAARGWDYADGTTLPRVFWDAAGESTPPAPRPPCATG
jgi:hypothetical protein